jgi:hypothetical protein
MVQYLHTTAVLKSTGNQRRQTTLAQALRAIKQIVQVPSHAVSAAEAGIVEPLGKLLRAGGIVGQEDELPMLALEVLHVIASNPQARRKARFLELGLVRSIAVSLGKSATMEPKKPADSRADVTFLGLEILHGIYADMEAELGAELVLRSPDASTFLSSIASEDSFVRAMCATLLLSTNMKLPRHDADQSGEAAFVIPPLYGPPLILLPEKCAGYSTSHDAAAALLFRTSVLACAVESSSSDDFWNSALLQNTSGSNDPAERSRVSATLCAQYLALLTVDYDPFVPKEARKNQEYVAITRPLVRHRLLESLKDMMDELSNQMSYGSDPYVTSLLVAFNIPHICLSLWKDPAILDLAFELIKQIMHQDPDEVLHLFVEGKPAILSLFDLLNLDASIETARNVSEIRRFLASILGKLGESGLLADAIEKFDIRSSAIEALAAACISEEERSPDEDEDTTSSRLSAVLMRCLVDLCSVKDNALGSDKKRIQLSPSEADALAKSLGSKICHMVLSRFLERAKLQQYEIEEDEDIMDAPDVAMLCAITQHDQALLTLRSIGGLHALSLVAAEGELSAMVALKKACTTDASILLEGDTHLAIMGLLADETNSKPRSQLYSSAFDLLARLCAGSVQGRSSVVSAASCQACLMEAVYAISSHVGLPESPKNDVMENEALDDESDGGDCYGPPAYSTTEETEKLDPPSYPGDTELVAAACSFIASLASTKLCRDTLVLNYRCISSLAMIVESSDCATLQFAALQVLTSLAPYSASEGALSADFIAGVILKVLTLDKRAPSTSEHSANLICSTALKGLNMLFECITLDQQEAVASAVATHFKKSVKACSVFRSTVKEAERTHAPSLLLELSVALLMVHGKSFANKVLTQDVLVAMANLVQWRSDPKSSVAPCDARMLDAVMANCLLLLSVIIWSPEYALESKGINLRSLSEATLMLARPGKAPRKAIDLKVALERIADGADASASQSAVRVMNRLFYQN